MDYTHVLTKVVQCLEQNKKEVSISVAGILATYTFVRWISNLTQRKQLAVKRRHAQDKAQQALDSVYNTALLHETNRDLIESITQLSATELAVKLREEKLRPVQVLRCFQIKAIEAHWKYNCLIEPIIEAEEWALALESQKEKGPLYGIPVSIKENITIEGYDNAQGCSARLGKPSPHSSVMVEVLKSQGAIPFIRTNQPQLASSLESSQPIYGRTLNPHDTTRGPGGSSSGEPVVMVTNGSPIGLGSDTGGSIRCPAAMCGVVAIKPTISRVSLKGRYDFTGNTAVMSTASPIARSVDDLSFLLKSLLCPHLWQLDTDAAPIPFHDQEYLSRKPLRVGFYTDDGMCKAAPACIRAVDLVKDLLHSHGHEVVEWKHPDIGEGFWFNLRSMCGNGGKQFMQELENDEIDPILRDTVMALGIPLWIRKLATHCLEPFDKVLSQQLNAVNGIGSTSDWWDFVKEVRDYKHRVHESWSELQLDAVVCPAFGVTPLPLGSSSEMLLAASYLMPYNVLDYAAGVVPVTKVTANDLSNLDEHYPSSPRIFSKIKAGLRGSEGLPVAVQVVTPTWQDERCLRLMREIENAARYKDL